MSIDITITITPGHLLHHATPSGLRRRSRCSTTRPRQAASGTAPTRWRPGPSPLPTRLATTLPWCNGEPAPSGPLDGKDNLAASVLSYLAATRWPRHCCTCWRSGGLSATPTRGRPNGCGAALIWARPDELLQHCPCNGDLVASTLLDVMATLHQRGCLHTECCNALFLTECPMVLAWLNVATWSRVAENVADAVHLYALPHVLASLGACMIRGGTLPWHCDVPDCVSSFPSHVSVSPGCSSWRPSIVCFGCCNYVHGFPPIWCSPWIYDTEYWMYI